VTSVSTGENKYLVEKFEADMGYCIFCGLCVEACPYDALFMGYAYERARYRRGELVLAKEDLLESEARKPSGYFKPKIEASLPRQTLLLDRAKVRR
jgi:formate hydrogenlyase subunit 6/NADH:ubiquinone oxidoreductase subunit I